MLKVQEIRELIKLIDESSIEEFKYEVEGAKITMKKAGLIQATLPTPAVAAPAPAIQAPVPQQAGSQAAPAATDAKGSEGFQDSNLHKIESPMVGTFYSSSSPDADPFVTVGSKVNPDSVVCIVEAMKLFNEIEADVKGEIVEVLVENGQLVEYGQPLFLVKAE